MEFKKSGGNIYFLRTDESDDTKNYFSPTYEINSNSNKMVSLKIISYKALGITSNNELLQWEIDKSNILKDKEKDSESSPNDAINKKNNFSFLSNTPTSLFQEIKFKSITLNKSVCIGLDINGNIMVWGQSTEGILGLGFDISNVETPTLLEDLKEITEISLSDHHAVAINSSGVAYSWGTGKFGELGLERSIYSPVPQQILTDTCYSKVFCGNLVTCFLDNEGHFYYFGVVIKQLSGAGSTLTIKSLLEEQIYNDGKILFLEKQVEELENEKFSNIVIGNGFITLLTYDGIIFTLEYNDKLTKLFSKYYLYNISVTDDKIFGLAKDKRNINSNYSYYLFRWKSSYQSENDLYSDSWKTTVWKFIDDYNVMDNCKLLDTNLDKNILFLKVLDSSVNEDNMEDEINLKSNRKKIFSDNYLEFESEYDDSYNLKYKRNQSNVLFQESVGKTCLLSGNNNFNSFFALNKNYSFSPNFNQNMNKTVMFQNKSSSPLMMNNKNIYIGNISERNKKKMSEKDKNSTIKGNYIYNSNNMIASGKFGNNINNRNSKSDISDNINLYEIENSSISYNKSNKLRKRNNKKYNNVSENEKNDFNSDDNEYKEKELSKYRNEVDNIINNYKQKKKSYSFSIIGRGNKKDIINNNSNNLNILDKVKDDNLSYDSNNNINMQNQRYSIPMSLSNKKKNIGNNLYKISYNDSSHILNNNNDTPNNEKSLYMNSNSFSNNKTIKYKNKKIPSNDNKSQRNKERNIENDEENESESENNNNKNDRYKSKNSGFNIPSSKNKRKFKDKKLNNLVDQLSLIKEESENSIDLFKRKRIFSFDSNEKKKHMKGKDKSMKNIKKNKSKKGNNTNNYSDDDKSNNTDFDIKPEKKMKRNYSESDLYDNIDAKKSDNNDAYYNNNQNNNKYKNKSKNYKNNNRQYYGENEDYNDNENDYYNEYYNNNNNKRKNKRNKNINYIEGNNNENEDDYINNENNYNNNYNKPKKSNLRKNNNNKNMNSNYNDNDYDNEEDNNNYNGKSNRNKSNQYGKNNFNEDNKIIRKQNINIDENDDDDNEGNYQNNFNNKNKRNKKANNLHNNRDKYNDNDNDNDNEVDENYDGNNNIIKKTRFKNNYNSNNNNNNNNDNYNNESENNEENLYGNEKINKKRKNAKINNFVGNEEEEDNSGNNLNMKTKNNKKFKNNKNENYESNDENNDEINNESNNVNKKNNLKSGKEKEINYKGNDKNIDYNENENNIN